MSSSDTAQKRFSETRLQDYCGDGVKYEYGNDGNGYQHVNSRIRWKVLLPNGDQLQSNFEHLPLDTEGTFFYLHPKDFQPKFFQLNHLTSLDSFSRAYPEKRIYLREIRASSIRNAGVRRVFADEVLEILPVVARQQKTPIEESDDRLKKYQNLRKNAEKTVYHSIDLDQLNRLLEEFDIDKSLITLVPDPVYESERLEVIENGRNVAISVVSPDGGSVYDNIQAVLLFFLHTVARRNWDVQDCKVHQSCNKHQKETILKAMREIIKRGEYSFVSDFGMNYMLRQVLDICQSHHLRQHYPFGSTMYLDTSRAHCRVNSSTGYVKTAEVYGLPIYRHSFDERGEFAIGDEIPVWIARLFLMTGWATQFFDKENADLKRMIFEALAFKVPVEKTQKVWSFLNELLEQDEEKFRCEARNSKILRAGQERQEKLRQRKEQNKKGKGSDDRMPSSQMTRDEKIKEQQRLMAALASQTENSISGSSSGSKQSGEIVETPNIEGLSVPASSNIAKPDKLGNEEKMTRMRVLGREELRSVTVDAGCLLNLKIDPTAADRINEAMRIAISKSADLFAATTLELTPKVAQEVMDRAVRSLSNLEESEKHGLLQGLNMQTNPELWNFFCDLVGSGGRLIVGTDVIMPSESPADGTGLEKSENPSQEVTGHGDLNDATSTTSDRNKSDKDNLKTSGTQVLKEGEISPPPARAEEPCLAYKLISAGPLRDSLMSAFKKWADGLAQPTKQITPHAVQEIIDNVVKSSPDLEEKEKQEVLQSLNLQTSPLLWNNFYNGFINARLNGGLNGIAPSEPLPHRTTPELMKKPVENVSGSKRVDGSDTKRLLEKSVKASDPKDPTSPVQSENCAECRRTMETCSKAKEELETVQNQLEKAMKTAKRSDEVEARMKEMEQEMKKLKEQASKTGDVEKQLEVERKEKKMLEKKAKRVDEVEKMMKEKERELSKMKAEMEKWKAENEKMVRKADEVEKKMEEMGNELIQIKSESERLKDKDKQHEKSKNTLLAKISTLKTAREEAVLKISSLEEQIQKIQNSQELKDLENRKAIEEVKRAQAEAVLKISSLESKELENIEVIEELQMANDRLTLQIADQQQKIQNPSTSESFQSQIASIQTLLGRLASSEAAQNSERTQSTLLRHQEIKDSLEEGEQLKLAKSMTDRLLTTSNRSELRKLASSEYQQYEANHQKYHQTVVENIRKMEETGDCSLITPLPSSPKLSNQFMKEYRIQMDQQENELKDSECLICFEEMKPKQKKLKCEQCKKTTHLKCASEWHKTHRSCPHCRRGQLDPNEFPALR